MVLLFVCRRRRYFSLFDPEKLHKTKRQLINGSIPAVAEAIAKRDAEFIKNRARLQADASA